METWDVLETENAKKKEPLGLVDGTDNNSNGHVESVSTPDPNFSDPKKSNLGIVGVKSQGGGKASSGLFSSYKQRQRKVDDSPASSSSSSVFGSIRSFLGISRSEGKVAPKGDSSRRPFSASFSEGQDKTRSRTPNDASSTNSLQSERSRASSYSGSDVQVGVATSSSDALGGTASKAESETNSVSSKNSASPRRLRKTDPPRSRRALFVDAPMRLEYKHEPGGPSDTAVEEDRHVFLVSTANGIHSSESRPESGNCSTDEQAADHRGKYHKHYEIVFSPETSTSTDKNKSVVNENAVGNKEHAVAHTVKQVHQSLVPIVGLGLIDETNSHSVLKSASDQSSVKAKGTFVLGHCTSLDLEDHQPLNHPKQSVSSLGNTATSSPAPKILNHDHASPSSGSGQVQRETGRSLDNAVFISSRSENALTPVQLHKQEIPVGDLRGENFSGNVCGTGESGLESDVDNQDLNIFTEDSNEAASKTDETVEKRKTQNALESIVEHPGESSPSPLEDSMNSFERHEHEFGLDSSDVSPYDEFSETDLYVASDEETCPDRRLTSDLLNYMPSIIEAEQEIVSSGDAWCNGYAEEGISRVAGQASFSPKCDTRKKEAERVVEKAPTVYHNQQGPGLLGKSAWTGSHSRSQDFVLNSERVGECSPRDGDIEGAGVVKANRLANDEFAKGVELASSTAKCQLERCGDGPQEGGHELKSKVDATKAADKEIVLGNSIEKMKNALEDGQHSAGVDRAQAATDNQQLPCDSATTSRASNAHGLREVAVCLSAKDYPRLPTVDLSDEDFSLPSADSLSVEQGDSDLRKGSTKNLLGGPDQHLAIVAVEGVSKSQYAKDFDSDVSESMATENELVARTNPGTGLPLSVGPGEKAETELMVANGDRLNLVIAADKDSANFVTTENSPHGPPPTRQKSKEMLNESLMGHGVNMAAQAENEQAFDSMHSPAEKEAAKSEEFQISNDVFLVGASDSVSPRSICKPEPRPFLWQLALQSTGSLEEILPEQHMMHSKRTSDRGSEDIDDPLSEPASSTRCTKCRASHGNDLMLPKAVDETKGDFSPALSHPFGNHSLDEALPTRHEEATKSRTAECERPLGVESVNSSDGSSPYIAAEHVQDLTVSLPAMGTASVGALPLDVLLLQPDMSGSQGRDDTSDPHGDRAGDFKAGGHSDSWQAFESSCDKEEGSLRTSCIGYDSVDGDDHSGPPALFAHSNALPHDVLSEYHLVSEADPADVLASGVVRDVEPDYHTSYYEDSTGSSTTDVMDACLPDAQRSSLHYMDDSGYMEMSDSTSVATGASTKQVPYSELNYADGEEMNSSGISESEFNRGLQSSSEVTLSDSLDCSNSNVSRQRESNRTDVTRQDSKSFEDTSYRSTADSSCDEADGYRSSENLNEDSGQNDWLYCQLASQSGKGVCADSDPSSAFVTIELVDDDETKVKLDDEFISVGDAGTFVSNASRSGSYTQDRADAILGKISQLKEKFFARVRSSPTRTSAGAKLGSKSRFDRSGAFNRSVEIELTDWKSSSMRRAVSQPSLLSDDEILSRPVHMSVAVECGSVPSIASAVETHRMDSSFGHYGATADNAEWVAVLKPLLVDPEVVAHIYLRLANAYFVHATSKYDDRQVWIGRSIYLIVVNNKLCNFAHIINYLLSFLGLIKSEFLCAPVANVPSLLYYLEKLVRSFRIEHVRILSYFFARPNTVLTGYHDARVGLLKACFLAELATFTSTGPDYLLVAFTAISEYFVMLDSHVAENLTSQYLLPYLPKHSTQFVIHVLCYMGLLHNERPVQVVGDLTASLLLLRFVCRHAQLPSIEREIFLAMLTRPHIKFDLCNDERMQVIGLLDGSTDRSSRLA